MTLGLFPVFALLTYHLLAPEIGDITAYGTCENLERSVTLQSAGEHSNAVEALLSAALMHGKRTCAGLVLTSLAAAASIKERMTEAEAYAERSIKILELDHATSDPILLRPLQILWAVSLEQRKLAKARRVYQKMLQIRAERPEDRAYIHLTAALLFQDEGKLKEAESELLAAIRAWEETGRTISADYASLLHDLGALYIEQQRYAEARSPLERAWEIDQKAKDAATMDRIKLLETRAILDARNHEWREAAEKLRQALTMISRETRADPITLRSILISYAIVLRKGHRRHEARSVEQQVAALRDYPAANALVDATELLRKR